MPPALFQVEVTSFCNLDCAMCARSLGLKRPIGHMDIGLFKEIVDQSTRFKMPIHWFHHFGEPLLYPHLREALRYFRAHGTGPGGVSTNALLLNEERIDILLESAGYILCCMDSMDPEAYRNIRNNPHFEKVRSNVASLIAERDRRNAECQIVVQFLRTQHNRDEDIGAMMDYFGFHPKVKYIEKRTDKHPKGADLTVFAEHDGMKAKLNCAKIRSELCILSSGECLPCCWDADGDQVIGKLPDQTLAEVWQGHRHRKMHNQLVCAQFELLPLCDRCSGPVSDADFGVIEQVNAWVKDWIAQGARVVLAPASQAMYRLLDSTILRDTAPVAICDAHPEVLRPPAGIPILPYEAVGELKPDIVFIYAPRFGTEIYFQLRHLRERGIRLVTLGSPLD